ncbi:alpha/beta hydrolase family protein [Pseudoalteromonas sp. S16_S37]|uniref:alpha/beta hydrolase family protein n=1 Tax=Pseudoalteromonas sp. S16_S37 TaxID=2720228 RepID=UPI0016800D2E|nr:prolyl oligopeptidase family serine peptidase [Pseudoalteromonas sp. S16_S37]MBD1583019.1 S9 family peptidase [Pseudoalteromonas sp. S16_S37]
MKQIWLLGLIIVTLMPALGKAEQATGYQTPSPALAKLVDAKLIPSSFLSADGKWLALLDKKRVVPLSELNRPELALAGIKFNPQTFMRKSGNSYVSLEFKHVDTGSVLRPTGLPTNGVIRYPQWSSDSRYLSFVVEQDNDATLWVYDIKERETKQLTQSTLNGIVTETPYEWLPDSKAIVVNFAINHGQSPLAPKAQETVPVIQQSRGEKAPARTYQNLLKSPFDEAQFKFYAQGQLAKISLNTPAKAIGKPTLVKFFSVSPDSTSLIVGMIAEPFSYQVPYERFASVWQVWGMTGFPLYELAKQPLADNIPQGFDSVRTGPREFQWRADEGATVVWAQAQDEGNMKNDVPHHDYLYSISAPFKREPELFAKVENRFSSILWADDEVALLTEWRFSDRSMRTSVITPRAADVNRVVFSERSYNDAYKNPGKFITTRSDLGSEVLKLVGGRYLFLHGKGASKDGSKPFLDRYDIKTNSSTRIWQSQTPYYERVKGLLDDEGMRFVTIRESQTEQPNFFIRDLNFDTLTQLTRFAHPYPEFNGVKKEQLKYKRDDGVELTGNLYLPANYDVTQGPIPVLMWAYPLEYKDKKVASQVRESQYEFPYFGYWGPMPYLANGIAVFDDPKMPIVGEGNALPNDSFRKQLVASAKAAVDVLVEKGIADKDKIAIAGHSYGAFMVANLLAQSDLFVTGIARSGAYNRTLTPFGFQGEERDFWQATEIYANMSPFFHAEKINEPMLMIHGQDDPNSGTFPMQSERMFAALNGLGKQARLVMLPNEGHGYKARESILHVLWEQEQWLKKYLFPKAQVEQSQEQQEDMQNSGAEDNTPQSSLETFTENR